VINTAFNGFTQAGPVAAENAPMFWDNRTFSLENQALGPPTSFVEMRGHAFGEDVAIDSLVARLQNIPEYVQLFGAAFSGRGITDRTMAEAIATFERTIVARNSPFDRFQAGDVDALNGAARRGLTAFVDARCNTCHGGPMFSDYTPHAIGVPDHSALEEPDGGVDGSFAFRTPTLRNLRFTAPYMHNGTSRDLEDVMQFYLQAQAAARGDNGGPGNGGGNDGVNPNVPEIDPLIGSMQLRPEQVGDIIAFMESLNDPNFDREIPDRVPSGLPVGGI
jgi:cytochrome c peroxidase